MKFSFSKEELLYPLPDLFKSLRKRRRRKLQFKGIIFLQLRPMTMQAILLLLALVAETYAHLGSCEDHYAQCPRWQALGYCDTNVKFMAENCPRSCNICVDEDCFDRHANCGFMLRFCRTDRTVQQACPHSCDVCHVPEPKTITRPDFDCGRPVSRFRIRGKRQIVFPGEPGYSNPLQQILPINGRRRITAAPAGNSASEIRVNDAFCGATVIHERFLITAAHCVLREDRPPRMVRVGELDFASSNEAHAMPADYRVRRITVHPRYKKNSLERYNDIAVIETAQRIQFNEAVYPHCLSDRRPAVGSIATGSGFGRVNGTHRLTHAQEADLRIINSRQCEQTYINEGLGSVIRSHYPQFIQRSDIICAAFPGRDACQGDSGGPLYQEDALGRRYLVGVISQGIPCRGQTYTLPGFYVSVADHIDFINHVIYRSG